MLWQLSNRSHPKPRALADRHYSRQNIGATGFMPPGSCMVLYAETATGAAVWGTSAPMAEYVKHAWAGAWMCSIFRNEGAGVASELILQAVAATRWHYGEPPEHGMITFIDREKVKPTMVRGEPVFGWTFRRAGFVAANPPETVGGLLALQLRPEAMPAPKAAIGFQRRLFG